MKNTTEPDSIIGRFFAAMYGNDNINHHYKGKFVEQLRHLREQAFPGYKFDPDELLAQAERQLRGNELALRNFYAFNIQFEPLSGKGDKLVINIGSTCKTADHPNGTLGIWTANQGVNAQIQSLLKEQSEKW